MKKLFQVLMCLCVFLSVTGTGFAKSDFKVAWSHYTGWEPWQFIKDSGLMDKWAKKYGISVEIVLVNDYMESVAQFTAGAFDAVAVTNMDALTNPALGGVPTEVVIVGDYSNGNDGVATKSGSKMQDIKGRNLKLVALSVSHYLLARCLQKAGMTEKDVSVTNVSDADINTQFATDPDKTATVVTWNPILMSIRQLPGVMVLCDSNQIPGEILDMLVVNKTVDERFKKAVAGAWFEAVAMMKTGAPGNAKALAVMAKSAGGTLAEYKRQLTTTHMYYTPADAVDYVRSIQLKVTMEFVRTFCFDHGLYGKAKSKDEVGIQFPDGNVMGNPGNVKMFFTDKYMKMAADGQL